MILPTLAPLSVSPDTVRGIIGSIFQGDADTRNGLAEQLKISSMTVGKVVRALLQVGLVRETVGCAQVGRTPSRLIVSDSIAYGMLCVAPRGFAVAFTDPLGREGERMLLPYNHSLDFEANLICLRRLCEEQRRLRAQTTPYFASGVILHPSMKEYALLCRTVLDSDALLTEDELIACAPVASTYGKTVLCVAIGEKLDVRLYCDGVPLSGNGVPSGGTRDEQLRIMLDAVSAMATVVIPDCVIIESESLYACDADTLRGGLHEALSTCVRMPRLLSMGSKQLAVDAMRNELNRRIAEQLSASIGG